MGYARVSKAGRATCSSSGSSTASAAPSPHLVNTVQDLSARRFRKQRVNFTRPALGTVDHGRLNKGDDRHDAWPWSYRCLMSNRAPAGDLHPCDAGPAGATDTGIDRYSTMA